MTIAQIIALIRDTLIVGALGFLVYRIYTDGENRVKLEDMQAVQAQLTHNAQVLSQYHQEAQNAAIKHTQDLAQVTTAIAAHSGSPVLLCPSAPRPGAVPSPAGAPAGQPAGARGTDAGSGGGSVIDIRPQISAIELRYEQALSDCRQVLNAWPH